MDKCFACDRKFRGQPSARAITEDGAQTVYVGWDCYRHIAASGTKGYQPPKGGPRLFTLDYAPEGHFPKGGA